MLSLDDFNLESISGISQMELKGGYVCVHDYRPDGSYGLVCGCACAYENSGGSSTADNTNANKEGGLFSPGGEGCP